MINRQKKKNANIVKLHDTITQETHFVNERTFEYYCPCFKITNMPVTVIL